MKKYYWSGTVAEFLDVKDPEKILQQEAGESVDIKQIAAWKKSLPLLQKLLVFVNPNLHLVLEYLLPGGNERIDALLIGGGYNRSKILILELKGWHFLTPIPGTETVKCDLGVEVTPSYQLQNYVGKISASHSAATHFQTSGLVYLYNAARKDNPDSPPLYFFKENERHLINEINALLTTSPSPNHITEFLTGHYTQNDTFFTLIKKKYQEIKTASFKMLADAGAGLSTEQMLLAQDILTTINNGQEAIFLIEGKPGSGKTLVAVETALMALQNNHNLILCYRNNRFINSLRRVIDKVEPGQSHFIKYFSTPNDDGPVDAKYRYTHDVMIFDEAQRMEYAKILNSFTRSKVSVHFYDPLQILGINEAGTTENFTKVAKRTGKPIKHYTLGGTYRILGGEAYHAWIENLLANQPTPPTWTTGYDLRVFSNFADLKLALHQNHEHDSSNQIGLLAAFTESTGDKKHPDSDTNRRIGFPLQSKCALYQNEPEVRWLMNEKTEYPAFWLNHKSNDLTTCASVYGCQGFELDYAGVVWGRDFIYRQGKWILGPNCTDTVGGRDSLHQLMVNKDFRARQLLINRYRIFLTRGRKGTYIFCEDEQTGAYLQKFLHPS